VVVHVTEESDTYQYLLNNLQYDESTFTCTMVNMDLVKDTFPLKSFLYTVLR